MKTFFSLIMGLVFLIGSYVLLSPYTSLAQSKTNNPPVNVFIIVLTSTNQLPSVLNAITNSLPDAVVYRPNPKISQLETIIRLMEEKFKETYSDVPETFVGNGTPESSASLDKLIAIWKQKKIDAEVIKTKKDELKKLPPYCQTL